MDGGVVKIGPARPEEVDGCNEGKIHKLKFQ